jgi:hypothetical protein
MADKEIAAMHLEDQSAGQMANEDVDFLANFSAEAKKKAVMKVQSLLDVSSAFVPLT